MLEGTGLVYEFTSEQSVLIKENEENRETNSSSIKSGRDDSEVEEIIITGTNIKGVKNIASPVSVHTQEDIQLSGAGSIHRFIQTLPENTI